MNKWILRRIGFDYEGFARELNIDKVWVRVMVNRGLTTLEDMRDFINKNPAHIRDYEGLPDIEKSVAIIEDFVKENKRVRIIGDYDIDGVCSTTILVKGLKALGLNVDAKIPHRVEDGYGLNDNLISLAIEDGIEAIITCDNGISAVSAIDLAKANNLTVIITDHHEIPLDIDTNMPVIPNADAIVNPKLNTNTYKTSDICGAHVAFKLICALADKHSDKISEDLLLELEELSAFATVGDVMPLIGENRSLVSKGLNAMSNSRNIGLRNLIKARELTDKKLGAYHIGFVLGPCINATGRLDTAHTALELLSTEDENKAEIIAQKLIDINAERIVITEEFEQLAYSIIDKQAENNGGVLPYQVIVLYLEECHESIAGIIAGRVKERYNRPTIVLTKGKNGLKGSGRSIEEFHMKEHIEKCSDLLEHYGGHKMAAGLSLKEENLEAFTKKINTDTGLTDEDLVKKIIIDADMPLSYPTVNMLNQMDKLEPFGAPNTRPVFAVKGVRFLSGTIYEKNSKFAIYTVTDSENKRRYKLKNWGDVDLFNEYITEKFGKASCDALYADGGVVNTTPVELSILYKPEINEYNGYTSVQFVLEDYC